MLIQTSNNVVKGNRVGTNAASASALGKQRRNQGERIEQTAIGGTNAGDHPNLISGNTLRGLFLIGNGNTVWGNLIGTNAAGTAALSNQWFGMIGNNGNSNIVQGAPPRARGTSSRATGSTPRKRE